ncbi:MAG: fasciclin domain-containing protein [Caldilineaceae bacterium]|nr:fasciclin domain-containing protein [Caldilineaceae bacterium]
MSQTKLQRTLAALLIFTLLFSLSSALVLAAPAAQEVRAKTVTGSIDGAANGEYPKIWLGLETEPIGAQTTISIEWDRSDTNGIGFYILDSAGISAVSAGRDVREVNLAVSDPVYQGPDNMQDASFNATGSTYMVVVFNDSPSAAGFTLSTDNGTLVDASGIVSDPNAPMEEETADEAAADEAATDEAATEETVAEEAATEESANAATEAVDEAAIEEATDALVEATAPQPIEAEELTGELPEQDSQHYLGLTPSERDANITLRMTFEPQDQQELGRRLNFWVLDPQGFLQYAAGDARLSAVAIAAGSTDVQTAANERVANFTASGMSDYTVIVYNASNVAAEYTLSVENALLRDDSGQTLTAQEAQPAAAAISATSEVTGTTTSTATTTTGTTTATTTAVTRDAQPGGTYTIQSGDTLALVAADVYGDFNYYEDICAFNDIADCNVIEVGDVIQLPTEDQLGTTAQATPVATATPAAAAVASTTAVTETAAMTDTETITGTETVTDTAGAEEATNDAEAAGDVVDVLVAAGNYKTLLAGLEAAGLVDALRAEGPFTVFAPTDAAFEALEEAAPGALQELMAEPGGQLTQILLYHVSSGELMADDISTGAEVASLQGDSATLEIQGDNILINGANISAPDQVGSNGVVHGIDAVLIPPSFGQ